MKLTLRVDYLLIVNWWIFSSYNTHNSCRDHTGCMMVLSKGGGHHFVSETEAKHKVIHRRVIRRGTL